MKHCVNRASERVPRNITARFSTFEVIVTFDLLQLADFGCFLTTRLFHAPTIETELEAMIKEAEEQEFTKVGDTTATDADSATTRPEDPCGFLDISSHPAGLCSQAVRSGECRGRRRSLTPSDRTVGVGDPPAKSS